VHFTSSSYHNLSVGDYLAYEGAEKYTNTFFPHEHAKHEISLEPMTEEQILAFEKKINQPS
jgi:predicted DNA repair protein MutK